MPVFQPPRPNHDAIESERVFEHVIVTRMRGHITRVLVEQQFDQFRTLLSETNRPLWIIEQLELTGFDSGAVPPGARWFGSFKDRGGERVLFVSHHAASRMVVASLAFAVHAKLATFDSLKEAYDEAGLGPVELRPSSFTLTPPSR